MPTCAKNGTNTKSSCEICANIVLTGASMIYNPRPYEPCNAAPTATEIQRLRLEANINLQQINCYQPGTEHSGWLWILLDPTEWQELQMAQNNIASTDAAAIAALEPLPTCTRPTIFTILDAWTDKIITEHKEAHAQNSYHFQYKTNLERAILLDLCEAIPSELIADLQDEIGKSYQQQLRRSPELHGSHL